MADDHDVFLSHREQLVKSEQEQSILFDKSIITLASGAFGLSFLLFQAMGPTRNAVWAMTFAWIFFVLSISSTLSSFLFSQHACRWERRTLDEFQNTDVGLTEAKKPSKNWFAPLVNFLNWTSLVTFVVGAALLAFFAYFNLHTTKG